MKGALANEVPLAIFQSLAETDEEAMFEYSLARSRATWASETV